MSAVRDGECDILTYKGDDCHVAYRNLIRDSEDESGQVVKRTALSDVGLGFWPMSNTLPFIISAAFPVGSLCLA